MDISEFRKKKKQLDFDLTVAIAGIISRFKADTNMPPCGIRVNMVRSWAFGDEFADYIVGGVETKFDI